MTQEVKFYSPAEESVNIFSHALGFALSIPAFFALIIKAINMNNPLYFSSFLIYGLSLLTLYAASTMYHKQKNPDKRKRLRVFDHAAIYVLIAGTYTPYSLITLQGDYGWWLFGIIWGMALTGIILKIFFTGRYSVISTLMYVLMGWLAVFVIRPLMTNLSTQGLFWLATGGIAYTIGAIIYSIKSVPFNHAIFHIFVLAGSACHFISVYFYV
ncbi:MAG: hemolysin III family protein [Chlorobi bacterium]|nr:hemolysin III family protein [Chlorobiota bacterium]